MSQYVAVIGTGTMASGIAAGFISHSIPVAILGRSKGKSSECLKKAIQLAIKIGLHGENAALDAPTIEAAQASSTMEDWAGWDDCSWVIETIAENLELKKQIFAYLDTKVPAHIPIGSNSSGFPITKISTDLKTANRMMGAHYFMPAEVVPLVEIVMGEKTGSAFAEQVCQLYKAIDKKPVLVKKDIPGFLANRIQHALMREALSLVQEGIASPEDIDDAVRYSFGFRYAAVGPMTQKEISGWDGMANAAKEIYPSLSNITTLPPKVVQLMNEGKTGMKAGEGFRKWTPEEIQQTSNSYSKRLKAAFDVLSMD
ncbi:MULTISPECIES: 3-hydroxyacyl-CoA dehydrogenase NAD-binding domain-containing protein [unclassified Polynucleobacter]|jgi:3-hydroxybutyryl-CoA dehydrogenase|uniref:3-hydroxyacyl-CoA dehydrogenase NAD-binding domain-containing protein n=1 Tax=unclassified Polynucleobacter TaxID=2640945 RepID=UPI000BD44D9E|nr:MULTISPECIES: 3-hydroxyacyl-CoA dehydrogenase NAD-binding domain-containing protein [unclassified Polynucleobacter]OYY21744.1 MAG: 3-hydroxyacyl-CoA dehydrogenase [Polynucleobacter sp. 35-46-11]OZA78414.1 MAG: 3-hydroxyacyl-CoA dehydrogenase [Polynucleobacter sp. 39-46-10]